MLRRLFSRLRKRRERGQGMTEYIIIVALIAIGAIAVVTIFGNNIRALFASSADALAGSESNIQTQNVDENYIGQGLTDFNEGVEATGGGGGH